jgi:transcriptional regulator with XRE-family HTH domain
MSKEHLARALKRERRQRSWSQAQLAEAAGVSLRTIQRVEMTGHCAPETLLSIAAALDVEVGQFTSFVLEPARAAPDEGLGAKRDRGASERSVLAFHSIAALLKAQHLRLVSLFTVLPALYFAAANVLKEFGVEGLYRPIEVLLADPERLEVFNAVSPPFFLGSLLFALVLNLLAIVELDVRTSDEGLSSRIIVRRNASSLAVITTALVVLGILVGYGSKYLVADVIEVLLAHLG